MKRILAAMAISALVALAMAAPILAEPAAGGGLYVDDQAGLLSPSQAASLESRAKSISDRHRCEVRILTVRDMGQYGYGDIEEFAYGAYTQGMFGYGPGRDCVLLTLSDRYRDYDLRVWGSRAKGAFTLYGIDMALDRHILPPMGDDDYYGAFGAFLDQAERYLTMAEDGDPFDSGNDPDAVPYALALKVILTLTVPLIIAWGVCHGWKAKMRTAVRADAAANYIVQDGFELTSQSDVFLYRTRTRRKIESGPSGGGGGGARGGMGGSSGRSGKY
ncbi:MAG: TPM domain-containing protein [Oscillospiraceae bacterium]|nr:TPM domain-containing protein [Oscillospiraceae bacterium]